MEKTEIVINGRAQVVDILKRLSEDHKNKILKSLIKKSPNLANELAWQTLTFESIVHFESAQISILIEYVSTQILAMALSDQPSELQRKLLGTMNRERAKETFMYIKSRPNKPHDCKKAREKIVDIATTLMQKKIIELT